MLAYEEGRLDKTGTAGLIQKSSAITNATSHSITTKVIE